MCSRQAAFTGARHEASAEREYEASSPTPYKESDMTERCSALVHDDSGWHRHQCRRSFRVERNGAKFCTQHDPERVAARNMERYVAWEAEQATRKAAMAKVAAIEQARYDAVKKLIEIEHCCHPDGLRILPDSVLADSLRRIIGAAGEEVA